MQRIGKKNQSPTKEYFVNQLPKELREELVPYCEEFAYVLESTELFEVPDEFVNVSRDCITIYAAKRGYLSLLEWARGHGCPWDQWTCYFAASEA